LGTCAVLGTARRGSSPSRRNDEKEGLLDIFGAIINRKNWSKKLFVRKLLYVVIDEIQQQANYTNALAVSISSFLEPAGHTLVALFFSPWVNFFMTLGEIF
jgi:hypothetical protein